MSAVPCRSFVPFPFDVSVCDTCGHLGSDHAVASVDRFHESMWKVMLAFGGIHSYYSGSPSLDERKTDAMREHMAGCAINWRDTHPIDMDMVDCFVDSFSDSIYVPTLIGELSCRCDMYFRQELILPKQSMGQLIWRAAHIDD